MPESAFFKRIHPFGMFLPKFVSNWDKYIGAQCGPGESEKKLYKLKCQANDNGNKGLSEGLPRTSQSTRWIATLGVKKERRVIVAGDSLLRETEHPVCQSDPSHKEVCCLLGPWVGVLIC